MVKLFSVKSIGFFFFRARGDFYLKTAKSAPFAVQDLKKEDL